MEIKILNETEDRIEFEISETNVALMNALRRIIISEIPVLAIDEVHIYENSSCLDNEVLAHRLGLIPIRTVPGGAKSIALALDVSGPGTVYSKDLKVFEGGKLVSSEDVIPYGTIPIVKLTEWQRIKLEAIAKLGKAKEHSKWQAGLASYETEDEKTFKFFVESYGQLSPRELLAEAFRVLEEKLNALEKVIEKD